MNKVRTVRVRPRALPWLMFRRLRPQKPAPRGRVPEPRDETGGRRVEVNDREPHGFPEYGWGWYYGELVCPLSWLLAMNRSHDPHPEAGCDDD
jgi:hypothetical protein